MVGKLVLHEKFNERLKEEKKKHGKNFRYMPTHLKEMREEALEKGKIVRRFGNSRIMIYMKNLHSQGNPARKSTVSELNKYGLLNR